MHQWFCNLLSARKLSGSCMRSDILKLVNILISFVSKMNTSFLHTMNGNKPFDFLLRFTPWSCSPRLPPIPSVRDFPSEEHDSKLHVDEFLCKSWQATRNLGIQELCSSNSHRKNLNFQTPWRCDESNCILNEQNGKFAM